MRYKIIRSTWHSPSSGHVIGVVSIESHGNSWKAYIGVALGVNLFIDEQEIAGSGSPLGKKVAQGYFPELNIENYGNL